MMLVTVACAPPSCSARLPQKFSAATTVMAELSDEDPGGLVAHPETAPTNMRRIQVPALVTRRD